MSYWCHLNDPVTGECLETENPHFIRGGTYAMNGTKYMELNVAYNYGPVIADFIDGGLKSLNGKTGAESIPILKGAICGNEARWRVGGVVMEQCCATCDRFALEPGKRKSGVCFGRWIPGALCNGTYYGAYVRVSPWDMCDNWIKQGSIERLTPYTIEDDQ